MDLQTIQNEIGTAVEGLTFPAHRDDIVNNAQQSGVSGELLDALKQLPSRSFASVGEVVSTLSGNIGEEFKGLEQEL